MSSDFYHLSLLPYASIIVRICRAYTNSQEDFEDYYQEACLQIWRTRENFREQCEWSTWIYRIALNVCLTMLRKNKKNDHSRYEIGNLSHNTIENKAFESEDLNHLYAAIKLLSEVDRAVILLYLEEKPYQEIANILGTNPNNIGVRVKRIKERLKKIIDGKYN